MRLSVEVAGDNFIDEFIELVPTDSPYSYTKKYQVSAKRAGGVGRTWDVFNWLVVELFIDAYRYNTYLTSIEKTHLITESKIRNISWEGREIVTPIGYTPTIHYPQITILIDYNKGAFNKIPVQINPLNMLLLFMDSKHYLFDPEYLKISSFRILRINRNDPAFINCTDYKDWDFVIITDNEKPIEVVDVVNSQSVWITPKEIANPIQTIGAGDVFTAFLGIAFTYALTKEKKIDFEYLIKSVEFACFGVALYISSDTRYHSIDPFTQQKQELSSQLRKLIQ